MIEWQDAIVEEQKILGYLLAQEHPTGRGKAAFFLSIGYAREEWTALRDDLITACRSGDVTDESETPWGIKYVVDADLASPARGAVRVRTVWMARSVTAPVRLITAYPAPA